MRDKLIKLFFVVLAISMGRVYVFANDYLLALIYHCIALHILLFVLRVALVVSQHRSTVDWKISWACFIVGFLYMNFIPLFTDSIVISLVYHCIAVHVLMIFTCIEIVRSRPYSNMSWKVYWFVFTIGAILAGIFFTYVQLSTVTNIPIETLIDNFATKGKSAASRISITHRYVQDLALPVVWSFVLYVLYMNLKRFDKEYADNPDLNNIIMLYRYPKSPIGMVLTLFAFPFNSVSVYVDEYQYTFLLGENEMIERKLPLVKLDPEIYFIKNTNITNKDKKAEIRALVGTKKTIWRYCLNVYKPVVGNINRHMKMIW
ncbi:MAG: hypothetical protein GY714_20220 [Desulfobacterales bacterium]|nr:hypothetical protein [Desulfobacterales bacterium]